MPLQLRQGGVYVDGSGSRWVCFRVNPDREEHAKADCIRVSDERIEYFYLDGRYDPASIRELNLVCEVTF